MIIIRSNRIIVRSRGKFVQVSSELVFWLHSLERLDGFSARLEWSWSGEISQHEFEACFKCWKLWFVHHKSHSILGQFGEKVSNEKPSDLTQFFLPFSKASKCKLELEAWRLTFGIWLLLACWMVTLTGTVNLGGQSNRVSNQSSTNKLVNSLPMVCQSNRRTIECSSVRSVNDALSLSFRSSIDT